MIVKKAKATIPVVFASDETVREFTAHVGDEVLWDFGDLAVSLQFNHPDLIDATKVFGKDITEAFSGPKTLTVRDDIDGDKYSYTLPYRVNCAERPLGYLEGNSHPVMIIKKP